jgi:hypothetical protein
VHVACCWFRRKGCTDCVFRCSVPYTISYSLVKLRQYHSKSVEGCRTHCSLSSRFCNFLLRLRGKTRYLLWSQFLLRTPMQAIPSNAWRNISFSREQPYTVGVPSGHVYNSLKLTWSPVNSQPPRGHMSTEQRKWWLQPVSRNAIYLLPCNHG